MGEDYEKFYIIFLGIVSISLSILTIGSEVWARSEQSAEYYLERGLENYNKEQNIDMGIADITKALEINPRYAA